MAGCDVVCSLFTSRLRVLMLQVDEGKSGVRYAKQKPEFVFKGHSEEGCVCVCVWGGGGVFFIMRFLVSVVVWASLVSLSATLCITHIFACE
jgi:hypothetical protein